MIPQRLFSDKYLNAQFEHLNLSTIENLTAKLAIISNWQKSIKTHAILNSTEASLQGDFLNQFFIQILNYSSDKSQGLWTLATEHNTPDGKQMDAALGYFWVNETGKNQADVRVVIELKNAKTDLDKPQSRKYDQRTPVQQAFDYANSLGGSCRWVIVANFMEIRLYYPNDRTRYETFDILSLDKEAQFKAFFFLLNKERLIKQDGESATDKLYVLRQAEQQNITQAFYQDYKQARVDFLHSLKTLNPEIDELVLLEKTQKLLDRILFIHFCEDYNILDLSTLHDLIENANKEKYCRNDDKIYRRLLCLFDAINRGYPEVGIHKFNGGLFAEDLILTSLVINDTILKPLLALIEYDFLSDLNVNILGHIFEQSISDIEDLKAQISGTVFDKTQGKRKKDGIYYTPEYITRSIVEEAIGAWLADRKAELNEAQLPELTEADFHSIEIVKGGKNSGKLKYNATIAQHLAFYESYSKILAEITVLDPACGSGAFLNQAFDYLSAEGKRVNAELTKLRGGQVSVLDVDKHILQHNLYGVDLNYESVQITKLSLWLKTANRYKELTSLDETLKIGNSLIAEVALAGKKAFVWENEFKTVMESGGFDVIISNPPYGAKFSNPEVAFLRKNYQTFEYQVNSYTLFYEKGLSLLKNKGILAYITPATFTYQHYFKKLRQLLQNYQTFKVIKYQYEVFEDANIGDAVVWFVNKIPNNRDYIHLKIYKQKETQPSPDYLKLDYAQVVSIHGVYQLNQQGIDYNKLAINSIPLGDLLHISAGIKAYQVGKGIPKQTQEIVKAKVFTASHKIDSTYRHCVNGKDFHRYTYLQIPTMWLSYGKWLAEPRESVPFTIAEKLIIRQTADALIVHYDNEGKLNLNNVYNVWRKTDDIHLKYVLTLLNSKLLNHLYQAIAQEKGRLFAEVKKVNLERLPIKVINLAEQQLFIEKANLLLQSYPQWQQQKTAFLQFIQAELNVTKSNGKLNHWHELNWDEFKNELEKCGVNLDKQYELKRLREWQQEFEQEKQKSLQFTLLIEQTTQHIDAMVYQLYGLTDAEIKLIEG